MEPNGIILTARTQMQDNEEMHELLLRKIPGVPNVTVWLQAHQANALREIIRGSRRRNKPGAPAPENIVRQIHALIDAATGIQGIGEELIRIIRDPPIG